MQSEIEALYKNPDLEKSKEGKIADSQLKFVMSEKYGRAFVFRMISDSGVLRSAFAGNHELSFIEGRRLLGVSIMNDCLRVCPDLFTLMIQEHNANE